MLYFRCFPCYVLLTWRAYVLTYESSFSRWRCTCFSDADPCCYLRSVRKQTVWNTVQLNWRRLENSWSDLRRSNMSTEELSASDSEAVFANAGERWAPVGAVASPEDESGSGGKPRHRDSSLATDDEMAARLRKLEEEQDLLNSSLLALTSHFAQVQFRLKQIVHAQSEEKERMLADLEEFAFRGCPHVVGCRAQDAVQMENSVRLLVTICTTRYNKHDLTHIYPSVFSHTVKS